MVIRELKKVSANACREVNHLLLQLLHDPKDYRPLSLSALRGIVDDKKTIVVVVYDGVRIIGMGLLFLITKPRGRYAYIEDMVIDIAYRGRGLGKKLARKLIAAARSRGVRCIELSTRPSRVAANKIYQDIGFKRKETNVYRLKL